MKEYEDLLNFSKKTAILNSIHSLLTWDQETFMPHGAIEIRSSQIAQIAEMVHERRTDREFLKKLEKLIDIDTGKIKANHLTTIQKKALVLWRKDYLRQTKLPASFVKEFSETTSLATQIWAKARKENDFLAFAPTLGKLVGLNQKQADILGYENHPYDALMDLYEPEMTISKIDPLFTSLEKGLSELVKKLHSADPIDDSFLYSTFDHDKQIRFGNLVLSELKIDRNHMRLDESTHPFSIAMHPDDSRITTRIISNNFMSNIYSVLHEVGHGFYERFLPKEHFGSPICEALSLGIHESQSRFWETRIGKSEGFWTYFYPLLQDTFPKEFSNISFEKFLRAINAVKPSLIRVESDEVSYCLHILLRFDIEKELIAGTLPVKEIPRIWNQKMKDLLGICPQTDREGCLQDIHWSCGSMGYFPTYALGNLYASQFFLGFEKQHPDWTKRLSHGDLEFVKEFLITHIHQYGRSLTQDELAIKVSGSSLSEKPYLDYLRTKYHKIYRI